jgi:hypothetical protein
MAIVRAAHAPQPSELTQGAARYGRMRARICVQWLITENLIHVAVAKNSIQRGWHGSMARLGLPYRLTQEHESHATFPL